MAALRGNFPWRCFNINYHIASIGKRTDSDETFMCTATAVLFSFNREYRFLIVWCDNNYFKGLTDVLCGDKTSFILVLSPYSCVLLFLC